MIFALDFDGTFAEDQALWLAFVEDCFERGHDVITVTHRRDTRANRQEMAFAGVSWPIVFAEGTKAKAAIEAGYDIKEAVWIDDNPVGIGTGDESQPTTQSVFEIELRHALEVLTDGRMESLLSAEFAELITRIETVLGKT